MVPFGTRTLSSLFIIYEVVAGVVVGASVADIEEKSSILIPER